MNVSQYLQRLLIFVLVFSCSSKEEEPPNLRVPNENEFRNPILSSAPDPWVIQSNGWYYVTHTTGNSIRLYRTNRMQALKNAEAKTIWSPPASGMNSKNIWAPELHYINNKWYIYYAADNGVNENHRMWVLENTSADPFLGEWIDRGKLSLPEDKWAIDLSVFSHNGSLYGVWSGWETNTNVRQDIYIARMADALTVEGPRIRLTKPELPWELAGGTPTINEAPQFLAHNDKVFLVYSASGCWTDNYALGLLTAPAGSDVLNSASWTKSTEPVFSTNAEGQAFGPGHNSFFKSPDGTEDWIVYHANASAGEGCGEKRSMRMQKFDWTSDGFPNFGKPVSLNNYQPNPAE